MPSARCAWSADSIGKVSRLADRFEDLVAWQKAPELTAEIYRVTQTGRFARDFGLANQMQRAAVSVMANLAEGFDRNRMTDFVRFVEISRGSAAEVISHLYVAKDVGYLDEETWQHLLAQSREVTRLLTALYRSAQARLAANRELRETESSYLADPVEEHWALGTGHSEPPTFQEISPPETRYSNV